MPGPGRPHGLPGHRHARGGATDARSSLDRRPEPRDVVPELLQVLRIFTSAERDLAEDRGIQHAVAGDATTHLDDAWTAELRMGGEGLHAQPPALVPFHGSSERPGLLL